MIYGFVFFLIVIFDSFKVISQNNINPETWNPPHPGGENGSPPIVELETSHIEMNPGDTVEISIMVWKLQLPKKLVYKVYRVPDLHTSVKEGEVPKMTIPQELRIDIINEYMKEIENTDPEHKGYIACKSRIVIETDSDLSSGVYYFYLHGIFEPPSPSVHVWLEIVIIPKGYKIRQRELFPDKNLEIALRRELEKMLSPITKEDLERITQITYYPRYKSEIIKSLGGLQYCKNMKKLRIEHCEISDLSPLSNLVQIEELSLNNNHIVDISPLSNMTNLRELYLSNNNILDISPLSHLTKLEVIHLENNNISDLYPLIKNTGICRGDEIIISNNPLNKESIEEYIPILEKRDVSVIWNPVASINTKTSPYSPKNDKFFCACIIGIIIGIFLILYLTRISRKEV